MVNTGIKMNNIGEYLKVFVIDVVEEEMGVVEMPNTLKDMKRITGAPCIEIGDIRIGENKFKSIYASKTNENIHVSCADSKGKVIYRGNLIIVAYETNGNGDEILCSLTEEEIAVLLSNTDLMYLNNEKNNTEYNSYVLCNVTAEDR